MLTDDKDKALLLMSASCGPPGDYSSNDSGESDNIDDAYAPRQTSRQDSRSNRVLKTMFHISDPSILTTR